MLSGGPQPIKGEFYIPTTIYAAVDRAKAENRPIMVRYSTDTMFSLLIQAEDEIDPLEEERLRPILYATVYPSYGRAHIQYEDGRAELV